MSEHNVCPLCGGWKGGRDANVCERCHYGMIEVDFETVCPGGKSPAENWFEEQMSQCRGNIS